MFVGEFMCLIAYGVIRLVGKLRKRNQTSEQNSDDDDESLPESGRFSPLLFLPSAMCDLVASSLIYIGLNMTNAASFQMLRG